MIYTFNRYYLKTHIIHKDARDVYLSYPANEPEHTVVLKIFDVQCLDPQVTLKDFQQMEHELQKLAHPYIVPLYELGIEEGKPYVASEYVPGGSLRQRLEQLDRLTLDEALRIVTQVGQAVAFAHAHTLLHLNIKPENIFLNEQGEALLGDFSLGKVIHETNLEGTPDDRTVSYRAPEQLTGSMSARCDQYALGCLLYELITGVLPFSVKDLLFLWQHTMFKAPVLPSTLVPTLAHPLETVVMRALSKKPEERYRDVAALLVALKAATQPEEPTFPFAHLTLSGSKRHSITPIVDSFAAESAQSEACDLPGEDAVASMFDVPGEYGSMFDMSDNLQDIQNVAEEHALFEDSKPFLEVKEDLLEEEEPSAMLFFDVPEEKEEEPSATLFFNVPKEEDLLFSGNIASESEDVVSPQRSGFARMKMLAQKQEDDFAASAPFVNAVVPQKSDVDLYDEPDLIGSRSSVLPDSDKYVLPMSQVFMGNRNNFASSAQVTSMGMFTAQMRQRKKQSNAMLLGICVLTLLAFALSYVANPKLIGVMSHLPVATTVAIQKTPMAQPTEAPTVQPTKVSTAQPTATPKPTVTTIPTVTLQPTRPSVVNPPAPTVTLPTPIPPTPIPPTPIPPTPIPPTPTATAIPIVNMLKNPTFQGTTGWACPATVTTSNSTLILTPTATSDSGCWQRITNLLPNHTYVYTVYVSGSNPTIWAEDKFYWYGTNLSNYQALQAIFSTGSGTFWDFEICGSPGHGTVYAQNASVLLKP